MAQLALTSPSENWKPRFSSMSQKLKIVFDFFPDYTDYFFNRHDVRRSEIKSVFDVIRILRQMLLFPDNKRVKKTREKAPNSLVKAS